MLNTNDFLAGIKVAKKSDIMAVVFFLNQAAESNPALKRALDEIEQAPLALRADRSAQEAWSS